MRNPHRGKIAISKAELEEHLNAPQNSLIKAMYDSLDDLLYSAVQKGYINSRTGELAHKKETKNENNE
jgi:hypothetical protein